MRTKIRDLNKVLRRVRIFYGHLLREIGVEFIDGHGHTAYYPSSKSISIFIKTIAEKASSPSFKRRFGRRISLTRLLTLVLLHEVGHVHQESVYDKTDLLRETLKIGVDVEHDKSWIERDADRFARKEIKKLLFTFPELCGIL